MRKGFREKLRSSDIYQAPSQDTADVLAERLEKFVFIAYFSCLHHVVLSVLSPKKDF